MASTEMLLLFDLGLIQSIILFKWPIVKKHIIRYSLVPHIGYLVANVAFTSNLLHDRLNGEVASGNWIFNTVVEELMLVFSGYFLSIEVLQMRAEGLGYFKRVWNAMDVVPPLVQITLLLLQATGQLHHVSSASSYGRPFFAIAMSLSTLLLWLKFLYFLRIFDSTGFLVRAISTVIIEMRYFLLILLVSIFAFGDSYKVMDRANTTQHQFLAQHGYGDVIGSMYYTYLVGLGEFDDDFGSVGPRYCRLLFIGNTVFTTIILLNLFVAIISESFAKINEQGQRAKFREMADLITENEFLISYEARTGWVKNHKYLLYVEAGTLDADEMTQE